MHDNDPRPSNPSPDSAQNLDVEAWLRSKGFGKYAGIFAKQGITAAYLLQLTDNDLKDLGVAKLVERANLLSEISRLTAPKNTPPKAAWPPPLLVPAVAAAPAVAAKAAPRAPGPGPGPQRPAANLPAANRPAARPAAVAPARPAATAVPHSPQPVETRRRKWRFGGKFLAISVAVHLLFALGAAYYVVQTISAKRKLTFHGGPPSPNPSQRSLEHKVQMAKKKSTMSAPPPSRRVVTTGIAKVVLPEMPVMPAMDPNASMKMAGTRGTGVGFGPSTGTLAGGATRGGGGVTVFGFRDKREDLLKGTFYDLKQTPDGQPTPIGNDADNKAAIAHYLNAVKNFVHHGWNQADFDHYYRAKNPLYASQIYVPIGESIEAAKAFNVEDEVKADRWLVHYRGSAKAPRTGTFRFVGRGDNILLVRLNKQNIFDGSSREIIDEHAVIDQKLGACSAKGWELAGGKWFTVHEGERLDIEILIGDNGGAYSSFLLIEEKGVTYEQRKDSPGLAYPVFQLGAMAVPPPGFNQKWGGFNPETAKEPVIFQGVKGSNVFSSF